VEQQFLFTLSFEGAVLLGFLEEAGALAPAESGKAMMGFSP